MANKSKIRMALFDIGGVIIRASHEITFWHLITHHHLSLEQARRFYENPAYAEYSRGYTTSAEFHQGIVERIGLDIDYYDAKRAHHVQMHSVDLEVIKVMGNLQRNKVDLGFATATNEWQDERQQELAKLEEVSSIWFRSHEVGALKTDPGFFPAVIHSLGLKPDEILLVDDVVANLVSAQESGLMTILYQNVKKLKEDLNLYGLLPFSLSI